MQIPTSRTPTRSRRLIVAIDNFAYDTAKLLFGARCQSAYLGLVGPHAAACGYRHEYLQPRCLFRKRTGPPIVTEETTALDLAHLFLEAGVNPNPQLNFHRPSRGGNAGRFVDEIISTGATPLLRAAAGQDSEAVQLLLDYGARIDVPNVMGVTPLIGAAGLGMELSPRFNPDGDAEDRAIATIEILLAAGADVNAKITDVTGRTARNWSLNHAA